MKRLCIIGILSFSMLFTSGCQIMRTAQENNVMGKLTTTVFDDRNSFEDLKINDKIAQEVEVKDDNTAKKDYDFWKKIKIHFKNMKWR